MTRKDFQLIATVLNECRTHPFQPATGDGNYHLASAKYVAERMADQLQTTNPRFDRERFIAACLKD